MSELSQLTVCCVDHGLFLPLAQRLARDVKRVLYCVPNDEGFPTVNKCIVGDGFEDIEKCVDLWPIKNEVDFWCFPDIGFAGLQLELESQGHKIWGSRRADSLEINREKFHKVLADVGLPVPKFDVIRGITKLREFLKDKENRFLKISRFRGSMETRHWRDWKRDEGLLDVLAVRFGPAKELIPFLVFEAIDTPLEIGSDTYCVDGKWPSLMLHGIEQKDASYLSAVTKKEDMPDELLGVLDAFGPVLAKYRMRNQWSTEVRVLGGQAYFTDPTPRGGLPSTASQLECWENFSEIIWAGAQGELVDPVPRGTFTAEVAISIKVEDGQWGSIEVPKELQQWLKVANCCQIGGRLAMPDDVFFPDCAGWLVAIDDSPKAVIEKLKGYVELLPDGVKADIGTLVDAIKEVDSEEEEGIHFTDKPMPEPAEVVE